MIRINADKLTVKNNGRISSSTATVGHAGEVNIEANTLDIDGQGKLTGIFSSAKESSSGHAGEIKVKSEIGVGTTFTVIIPLEKKNKTADTKI